MLATTRPPVLGSGETTAIDDTSTALTTTDLPDSRCLTMGDADEVLGRAAASLWVAKSPHQRKTFVIN